MSISRRRRLGRLRQPDPQSATPRSTPETSSGTPGVGATEPSAITRQDGGIAAEWSGAPSTETAAASHSAAIERWTAGFARAVLDPAEVIRSSFPITGHVGAVPVVTGYPGRTGRGLERTQ